MNSSKTVSVQFTAQFEVCAQLAADLRLDLIYVDQLETREIKFLNENGKGL